MTYRIELAATAKDGIREAARLVHDQMSDSFADRWLDGLFKAIGTLKTQPHRCPVAAENDHFPEEIRGLPYGGQELGKHRIVFSIFEDTVVVLYVRDSGRDRIEL